MAFVTARTAVPSSCMQLLLLLLPLLVAAQQVSYEMWSTPRGGQSSFRTREFYSDFGQIAPVMADPPHNVQFEPFYYILDGTAFGCEDKDCSVLSDDIKWRLNMCTNKGRYCVPMDLNNNGGGSSMGDKIRGWDVVKESLRRLCLWQVYGDNHAAKWWDYHVSFYEKCNTPPLFSNADCIREVYNETGIDAALINQCMRDSGNLAEDVPNEHLDRMIAEAAKRDAISLGDEISFDYRGALSNKGTLYLVNGERASPENPFDVASGLFNVLCNAFDQVPDLCKQCIPLDDPTDDIYDDDTTTIHSCFKDTVSCASNRGVCPPEEEEADDSASDNDSVPPVVLVDEEGPSNETAIVIQSVVGNLLYDPTTNEAIGYVDAQGNNVTDHPEENLLFDHNGTAIGWGMAPPREGVSTVIVIDGVAYAPVLQTQHSAAAHELGNATGTNAEVHRPEDIQNIFDHSEQQQQSSSTSDGEEGEVDIAADPNSTCCQGQVCPPHQQQGGL